SALTMAYRQANSVDRLPYPDRAGDPYSRALTAATNAMPGSAATRNAIHGRRRHHRKSAGTTMRGTRFGRIAMASAADTPAAMADARVAPNATAQTAVQHAAAGTSVQGKITCDRKIGLAANRTAAPTPAARDSARAPRREHSHTPHAPNSGPA